MASPILVIGESGTGKSSSLKNLDPAETFIINVIGKPLPFRGSHGQYIDSSDRASKGNYFCSKNPDHILQIINIINNNRPDIKNLIIDDAQYIMCDEFMKRALESGWGKYSEMAKNIYSIICAATSLNNDLYSAMLWHSDCGPDGIIRCKTIGKMIQEKVTIEGMFTIVLQSMVQDGKYQFLTQNDGRSIAKSPAGMFDSEYIENDLNYVITKSRLYYKGEQNV